MEGENITKVATFKKPSSTKLKKLLAQLLFVDSSF